MKQYTFWNKIKRKLASIGWKLFLWGNDMKKEDYWDRIYRQEVQYLNPSKKVVESLGKYVNGLDMTHLGLPMMDEVAVMQMENIVEQILTDPSKEVEMPKYD